MKKIGYIFKYSEKEQKGILVYGHWQTRWKVQDKPIKFTLGDCKTAVKSGNLVYFEISETGVTNIERASLANFDATFVREIITEKKGDLSDWYYSNTHITFEYLGDIKLPSLNANSNAVERKIEDLYEELDGIFFQDRKSYFDLNKHLSDFSIPKELPESIDDLFDCFGKYNHPWHQYKYDSASIDIIDISLWIDDEILKKSCFGSSFSQITCLCDIFVYRKRFDVNGILINNKRENDCISNLWSLLINKFSNSEIRTIIITNPILQPILPVDFCMENLEVLSDKYGMPSIEICKVFNQFQITKAISATDYIKLYKNFITYSHCGAKHLEGEGVPMCKMGNQIINRLFITLEKRLKDVIYVNILNKFKEISGCSFESIYRNSDEEQIKNVLLNLGVFIDTCEDVINSYLSEDIIHNYLLQDITRNLLSKESLPLLTVHDRFRTLPKEIQDVLKIPTKNHINKTILEFARRNETLPSDLNDRLYNLDSWIDESTKKELCNIINLRFPVFYSLTELWEAYDCNLITGLKYLKEFRNLTQNFSIYELIRELKECRWGHFLETFVVLPLSVQWYIVSRIIEMFDFKSLDSFNYVKIDEYGTAISNIKTLLKWIRKSSGLDKRLFNRVERKITSVLTEEENWTLFKEELISSPGMNNIRNCLNKLYKKKSRNFRFYIHDSFPYTMYYEFEKAGDNYLTKDCFQDVMYNDLLKTNDSSLKILIADYLTSERQIELQRKCKGVLNLYMWIKNPDKHYDWNLITTYFAELPDEQQIRLLKYVFYLLANNQITYSIEELYSQFVQSNKKISPAITGILYLLKEKLSHPGKSLNIKSFKNEIGEDAILTGSFLAIKEFFFPCNGHFALTLMNYDMDDNIGGYITKTNVRGKEYYSITFYNERKKSIQNAKTILETNIGAKIIDGNYIVDMSKEIAIKQFVMAYHIDDRCRLFESKQAIYTNEIRPYSDESFDVCQCTNCIDVDPAYGLPFYWCDKKPCVRRCHYIRPISEWETYKLPDMLYILLGAKSGRLSKVWKISTDISQFINRLFECKRSISCDEPKLVIHNSPIKDSDEIGVLTDDLSIVQNICDADEYDDYDEREYVDSSYEAPEDPPTYERYAGTYAQDVAGYSDDDIDTIFDGDPDAYWNID